MYSVQCSDKICFPQLGIKCSVAKSCPGTNTALQAPMVPSIHVGNMSSSNILTTLHILQVMIVLELLTNGDLRNYLIKQRPV